MKSSEIQNGRSFSFCISSRSFSYSVVTKGDEVLLCGQEAERGKATFSFVLSYAKSQRAAVEQFAENLAESETVPQMMRELAEEYAPLAKAPE